MGNEEEGDSKRERRRGGWVASTKMLFGFVFHVFGMFPACFWFFDGAGLRGLIPAGAAVAASSIIGLRTAALGEDDFLAMLSPPVGLTAVFSVLLGLLL